MQVFQRNIRIKLRSLKKDSSSLGGCVQVYTIVCWKLKKWYASNHTYTLRRQKPSHALKLVLLLYGCINLWVRRSFNCWPRRIGVLIYNFSNDEASVLRTKTSRGFPLLRVMPHLSLTCIHEQVHIIAWFALLCTIHWCEIKNRLTTQFCVPPILVLKFSNNGLFIEV